MPSVWSSRRPVAQDDDAAHAALQAEAHGFRLVVRILLRNAVHEPGACRWRSRGSRRSRSPINGIGHAPRPGSGAPRRRSEPRTAPAAATPRRTSFPTASRRRPTTTSGNVRSEGMASIGFSHIIGIPRFRFSAVRPPCRHAAQKSLRHHVRMARWSIGIRGGDSPSSSPSTSTDTSGDDSVRMRLPRSWSTLPDAGCRR